MNRRHDVSDKRVNKKNKKEVKSGLKNETMPEKRKPYVKKVLAPFLTKKVKKTSKRTSPSDSIENSMPAYPHKEGGRWISSTNKQIADKNIKLLKKSAKKRIYQKKRDGFTGK